MLHHLAATFYYFFSAEKENIHFFCITFMKMKCHIFSPL